MKDDLKTRLVEALKREHADHRSALSVACFDCCVCRLIAEAEAMPEGVGSGRVMSQVEVVVENSRGHISLCECATCQALRSAPAIHAPSVSVPTVEEMLKAFEGPVMTSEWDMDSTAAWRSGMIAVHTLLTSRLAKPAQSEGEVMSDYYVCNWCQEEIPAENIGYDFCLDKDYCPLCKSTDVEYFKGDEEEQTEVNTKDEKR
jgi:hypothetical protein